ncbi:MAG: arginase family protein [Hyphomicrobiaceae bacterium]|nr:arginase family protein [Hyphomicrobiaceae bacterium]
MPSPVTQTFLGVPSVSLNDLAAEDIVILGAPEATPYTPGKASHCHDAPDAVRAVMARLGEWSGHYDFELDTTLIPQGGRRICDVGDLPGDPTTPEQNRARITDAVARVLAADAMPIVIGGDDSVPIPVLAAYENSGPIWVVQVDAHLDWRDEREGVREGWSSPMRRASEMPWVDGIVQIGIRGVGSARPSDVDAARNYGAKIFTAREVHSYGIGKAVEALPQGARCFLTIDFDGIDPTVVPAVLSQVPGGLTYWHIIELIESLCTRGMLVGADVVELAPQLDVNNLGVRTAGRIIANLAGNCSKASSG